MNTPDCRLDCGCWLRIPLDMAKLSAYAECRYHGQTHIRQVNSHEWHVRCQHPKCRYSRWCGQSKDEALRARRRHYALHPEHWIGLAYDLVTWDGKGTLLRDTVFDGKIVRRAPNPRPVRIKLDSIPPY